MTFRIVTTNKPGRVLAAGVLLAALGACGSSAPTQQLVDARRAYNDAAASSAARYTPDDLLTARQALEKAEREHDDDPGSAEELHYAYLAARKAQLAKAQGEIAEAKKAAAEDKAAYQAQLERTANESRSDLAKATGELESERAARTEAELDKQEAERRAALALQSLHEIAQIQEDQRGTVITLTGAVLFGSGQAELTPTARLRIDQVAVALGQQPPEKPIHVIGHTDARGSESTNQRLSAQRAQTVADQLAARGIDPNRVTVEGRGENEPIANNDTAEGRATNRRVEIIITAAGSTPGSAQPMQPPAQSGGSSTTMPQTGQPSPGSASDPSRNAPQKQPPSTGE